MIVHGSVSRISGPCIPLLKFLAVPTALHACTTRKLRLRRPDEILLSFYTHAAAVIVCGGDTFVQPPFPDALPDHPFEPEKKHVYPLTTPTWSMLDMLHDPIDDDPTLRHVRLDDKYAEPSVGTQAAN